MKKKFRIYRDTLVYGWRDDLRWVLVYPNGDMLCNCSFQAVLEAFKIGCNSKENYADR